MTRRLDFLDFCREVRDGAGHKDTPAALAAAVVLQQSRDEEVPAQILEAELAEIAARPGAQRGLKELYRLWKGAQRRTTGAA